MHTGAVVAAVVKWAAWIWGLITWPFSRSRTRADWTAYRGRLERAEREGDEAHLDRELARNQLTPADLQRLAERRTPIEQWPDEDFTGLIDSSATGGRARA